jgi:hypothetical protein
MVSMRKGRPAALVTVSAEQRLELESWSRRPKTAQALALRSRIILLAVEGWNNKSIALKLSTTAHTVGKWRRRFVSAGPDGLLDGTKKRWYNRHFNRSMDMKWKSWRDFRSRMIKRSFPASSNFRVAGARFVTQKTFRSSGVRHK